MSYITRPNSVTERHLLKTGAWGIVALSIDLKNLHGSRPPQQYSSHTDECLTDRFHATSDKIAKSIYFRLGIHLGPIMFQFDRRIRKYATETPVKIGMIYWIRH